MNKSKLLVIVLLSILVISTAGSFVVAQSSYTTQKTTPVTVLSDVTFSVSESEIGLSYQIQGNPGAQGSVTAQIYNGNPQPTASIPDGVSLTHFVVITFNMYSGDFNSAQIHITYTEEEVANLQAPFAVYKYVASSDSYVLMPSTVDTAAKTVTVTVGSIDDPLFAIGSSGSGSTGGTPFAMWVLLAVSIIVIILLAVVGVWYFKKNSA
jgi:NADH:ubiquinone oxidoreductase subunit K